MPDIFISYTRDSADFTAKLVVALKGRGISADVDRQHKPDEITRGIDAATAFLFLVSSDSLSSAGCMLELAHAQTSGKQIIPIITQPIDFDVPLPTLPQDDLLQQLLGERDLSLLAQEIHQTLRRLSPVRFVYQDGVSRSFDKALTELVERINPDLEHSRYSARLLKRAQEWENSGRGSNLLLIGNEITQAETWRAEAEAQGKESPTALYREYITASRHVESARLRRTQRIRWMSAAAITVIVLMVGVSLLGIQANSSVTTAQTREAAAMTIQQAAQNNADAIRTEAAHAQATAVRVQEAAAATIQQAAQNDADAAHTEVAQVQATVAEMMPTLTQVAVLRQEIAGEQAILSEFTAAMLANDGESDRDANQLIYRIDRLVEQFPDYALAYQVRGRVYTHLEDYEQAISNYNQSLELDPSNAITYLNRGIAYQYLENYTQAILDFNRAIELNPTYARAYSNRGNTYRFQEKYQRAINDFNRAIEIDPAYSAAYHNRGNVYYDLGQYDEALSDYDQAIHYNPTSADTYYGRGNLYIDMGQYKRAVDDFNQTIEFDPAYTYAYITRGIAYYYLGQYDEAISDYTQGIALDPTEAWGYHNRAVAYRSQGEYELAIADYTQEIELDPTAADAYRELGSAYFQTNRLEDALVNYRHYLSLGGGNANQAVRDRIAEIEAMLSALTPTPGQ
ncbi:MAG: tetratricopeptide repeat protein [Anaerolineaceae bacterium]|nr:tetratricopeptide repeat protein [Anaerolineaceae bacterium]